MSRTRTDGPPVADAPQVYRGPAAVRAVRWSSLSVVGRQGAQLVFAVVVARLIGPESYGAIGAATVLVTLAALLMDQGLSAALVQRDELPEHAPGAAATINLLTAALLAVVVVACAAPLAAFFHTPALAGMLWWLGPGLLLKAAAIAPRAMLMRRVALTAVAKSEVAASLVGAAAGIAVALAGAGPAAFVVMTLLVDAGVAIALLAAERGPVPNLRLRAFRPLLGFGGRVFATNVVAYASRNTDTVLVGRFLGASALAQYSMAYRVLVLPVQFLGQSLNRVLFPVLSRAQGDRSVLAAEVERATALLAVLTIPPMALIACAAPQLVQLVLGAPWLAAAPLMTVLAIAGARETVFYLTPVLMRAVGRAALGLRFQLVSTLVQVVGIVAGLPFGMLGVAVGYTVAGFVLVPALLALQHRLGGVSVRRQLAAIWPPLHAALWASAAYLLLAVLLDGALLTLLVGGVAFAAVLTAVLVLVHREAARAAGRRLGAVLGRGGSR
jgi:O-antigen/teichoic acid export membrane protein